MSLRSDRDFLVFWAAQALSEVGNAFSLVALPLLVLATTGSVAQMGLLTAVAAGAALLTGLVAGTVVDRVDRRLLLMICDAARMVLHGSVPVVWAVAGPQVGLLFVVAGAAAVFDQLFRVGYVSVVPALVGRDRIAEANGLLSTTTALALVGGPALAGVVGGLFGPTAAVAINAASFGASLLGLALLRGRRFVPTGEDVPHLRSGFVDGARFLWRHPVLRALTAALTVTTFCALGVTDLIIYRVRGELGQNTQTVGVVLALGGAGTCLAAVTAARLRSRWGFGACWVGAVALCAVSVLLLGLAPGVPAVAVAVTGWSFGLACAGINSMTLRQQLTPDPLLGRVTAAFWTIHGSAAPLGATLLTAAAGRFGTVPPLLAVAAVFAAVAALALLTPIRQRGPARGPPAQQTAHPRERPHGWLHPKTP